MKLISMSKFKCFEINKKKIKSCIIICSKRTICYHNVQPLSCIIPDATHDAVEKNICAILASISITKMKNCVIYSLSIHLNVICQSCINKVMKFL